MCLIRNPLTPLIKTGWNINFRYYKLINLKNHSNYSVSNTINVRNMFAPLAFNIRSSNPNSQNKLRSIFYARIFVVIRVVDGVGKFGILNIQFLIAMLSYSMYTGSRPYPREVRTRNFSDFSTHFCE